MIDIHSHILPAIDDGASDRAVAVSMLEMAAADGTKDLVLTPHADLRYVFDPVGAAGERRILETLVPTPRLHAGCELLITPENLERVRTDPAAYTIGGRDCLLVEMPAGLNTRTALRVLSELTEAGVRVVIAHPERSLPAGDLRGAAAQLVDAGCYLQLTAGSLLGSFGADAERAAERLLAARLAHFVASDAHGTEHRRPLLAAARSRVAALAGDDNAQLLFSLNGRAALEGDDIRSMTQPGSSRMWFFFSRPVASQAGPIPS